MNAAATAKALIAKNGAPGLLTRKRDNTFDPVTQAATTVTDTWTFDCVVLPPSQQARFRVGSLEGRNAVEVYFALEGMPTQPQPGDVLRWDGLDYRIFWAQTYNPDAASPILTIAYAER